MMNAENPTPQAPKADPARTLQAQPVAEEYAKSSRSCVSR